MSVPIVWQFVCTNGQFFQFCFKRNNNHIQCITGHTSEAVGNRVNQFVTSGRCIPEIRVYRTDIAEVNGSGTAPQVGVTSGSADWITIQEDGVACTHLSRIG